MVDLQKSLYRLPECDMLVEPAIVVSALSIMSPSEIALMNEYLFLRESGFDQATSYSFMDGRHQSAIKALDRLSEEYKRQEQAMKPPKRVKPSRYGVPKQDGVRAYLEDLGHVRPDEIRADAPG